jgi:predicted Zn-dependent protease with MMP-like domain
MKESLGPSLRAAGFTAFIAGLLLFFLNAPSLNGLGNLLSILAGALAIILVTAWVTTALIGKEMPEPDFQKLESRSEALGSLPPPARPPTEFDELVIQALDELPERFRDILKDVPVVVSHHGHEYRAYGHYMGGTVARNDYAHKIVIYQDTLERDFGHDPEVLRAQVERTVRHEVAHHLGWNESGVRGLGL